MLEISSEKIKELKESGFILSKDREHFSVRVVSGNGTMTSAQLRYLAEAAERFGRYLDRVGEETFLKKLKSKAKI